MSIGGSTNVMLHAPELARAAGYSNFNEDIMSFEEFTATTLSSRILKSFQCIRNFVLIPSIFWQCGPQCLRTVTPMTNHPATILDLLDSQ